MSRSRINNDDTGSPSTAHYSHNSHSFNSTQVINNNPVWNVNNIGAPDERSEILAWLSPLEPRIRHQDLRTRRADCVGEWLLQTNEFERWCGGAEQDGSEHATLFCYGGPGVGKTYFSSLVVDRICDKAKGKNIAVACFYVDFAARDEQSPENILGSLLKQIVAGFGKIPDQIKEIFEDHKKVIGGRGLRVAEIVKMLQTVTSLQPTFICVDALDECVGGHRPEVLDSLRKVAQRSPSTRIFLTGRQHVRREIEGNLSEGAAVLCIKPNNNDIVEYVRMRLVKDTSLDAMDCSLEDEIIKSISENIPETFLLISLAMDALLGETTVYDRRQKLRAMTDGLELKDVYGATLERIKGQGGEKARRGMAALMWISHSERLLQLDELLHALSVEIGSTDLNVERIPSVEALLNCCLGLVVVDREASIVRLIHYTLQEYLSTCPDIFGPAHSIMAETCLTYLNFQTVRDIPPTLVTLPQSTPFLKYSSLYWGAHARRQASGGVVPLALQLLSQIESHISTKLLLMDLISRTGRYKGDILTHGPLIGFNGLHCASVFGIVEITTSLVDQPNTDVNKRDFLGITPLIWAAMCGQEGVTKLLLGRQTISPDKPDAYFRRTALSWAAGKGRNAVVKVLLGREDVNANMPDNDGRTPLSWAARNGRDAVVKVLLGREDVNPDLPDNDGRTPLSWAARNGHGAVVKVLLGREDVNPNIPDNHGRTPLLWAAGTWRTAVVKVLLRREDVNPNMPDNDGRTPLSWAARNGRDAMVKVLLGREDVNPNLPDNDGRTPLSWAARNGHGAVVKVLLKREDVNSNIPDHDGRTPLTLASEKQHKPVIELLRIRQSANPNPP